MQNKNMSTTEDLPVIGVLGDGQLAMMMIQAYQDLGGRAYVFGGSDDGPASTVADKVFIGDPSNLNELEDFFNAVDVVTLENEFNDSELLSAASSRCATPLLPDPKRFGLIEDKLSEKRFFQELGVSLAEFFEINSSDDLIDAPGYLKIAKGGYDGIGTYKVNNKADAIAIYDTIKSSGVILFERTIEFEKELSVIAVGNKDELVFYPIVETHQEHGTCRYVSFPAGVSNAVEQQAQTQVSAILAKLGTSGLFAFEFFLSKDGQLIINESAPRPHNSGHITLDLTDCSQFENHMRAIAGLPLRKPQLVKESMTMINLLGTKNGVFDAQEIVDNVSDSESSITLYRKQESRIKRKMGHINIWGQDQQQRAEELVRTLEV